MKERIIEIAKENWADAVGFAPASRFDKDDPIFKIMPETKTVICLVFRLLRGSFRGIEEGTTYYQYTTMSVENMEETIMPMAQIKVSNFIEEKGYIALKKTELEEVAANIAEIDEKLGDEEIGEDIDEDALKEERKSLEQKAKKLKKVIKEATEKLTGSLLAYYAELDEKSVKSHVIRDKWITALAERFAAELTRVKAAIVSDVQALANRYAEPLPDAEAKVLRLEEKVAGHLAAMGIGN